MASSIYVPGNRPRRFANNKLSWQNEGRGFPCPFNHSNEVLQGSTSHGNAVLTHSRKWWNGVLAEFVIVKADQGDIVWNTEALLGERAQNADCHEIAASNNGSKIGAFS